MKAYLIDFENANSRGLAGIEKLEEADRVYIFYSDKSDTLSFEMHRMVMESKAQIEYIKVTVGGKNALDFQLSTFLGYLVAKETYSHIFVISGDKGFDFLNYFWENKESEIIKSFVYRTKTINAAINFANSGSKNQAEDNVENYLENLEYSAPDTPEISVEENENSIEEVVVSAEFTETEPEIPAEEISAEEKTEQTITADRNESFIINVKNILSDNSMTEKDIQIIGSLLAQTNSKIDFHNGLRKHFGDNGPLIYQKFKSCYNNLKDIYKSEMQSAINPETKEETVKNVSEKKEEKASSEKVTAESKTAKPKQKKKTASKTKKTTKKVSRKNSADKVVSVKLADLVGEYCNDEEIKFVSEQFESAPTKQQLYIRMIKAFKREKGCKIYGAIKEQYILAHSQEEK